LIGIDRRMSDINRSEIRTKAQQTNRGLFASHDRRKRKGEVEVVSSTKVGSIFETNIITQGRSRDIIT
jgi:hypothetical protein